MLLLDGANNKRDKLYKEALQRFHFPE